MDREGQTIHLLPSLIPEQARRITEVQRCTLHVEVVDLDKKVESHDTHSLVLLRAPPASTPSSTPRPAGPAT